MVRMTVGICLSPTEALVSTQRSSNRTSMEGGARPTLQAQQGAGRQCVCCWSCLPKRGGQAGK